MAGHHKIEPLDESSLRQILVGWGSTVAAGFLAYLSGGDWWAYAGIFTGLAIALRGHWPHFFIRHTEEQKIVRNTSTAQRVCSCLDHSGHCVSRFGLWGIQVA